MRTAILVSVISLLSGCASLERSIGLGAGIGAAAGITASQIAHYNTKGHLVLGLGGAIIGGALAALLHRGHRESPPPVAPKAVLNGTEPPLAGAEKDVLLVPDKIEGDQFIEKHRIWTIKKPARWQLKDGQSEESEGGEPNENGE